MNCHVNYCVIYHIIHHDDFDIISVGDQENFSNFQRLNSEIFFYLFFKQNKEGNIHEMINKENIRDLLGYTATFIFKINTKLPENN